MPPPRRYARWNVPDVHLGGESTALAAATDAPGARIDPGAARGEMEGRDTRPGPTLPPSISDRPWRASVPLHAREAAGPAAPPRSAQRVPREAGPHSGRNAPTRPPVDRWLAWRVPFGGRLCVARCNDAFLPTAFTIL